MVWCHEIARFHISNPSPPHKSRADLWKCRCFCDSEISGWHIKFKNSSSSRVLYSSAADFWEKNAQLFTEAVEKLSQTKIFESWCYASRKWVNKKASWEGSLPTSNPRSPVGLRVQGFTSVFIVSCWKSNRRLKLTLNHINHLIYILYICNIYKKWQPILSHISSTCPGRISSTAQHQHRSKVLLLSPKLMQWDVACNPAIATHAKLCLSARWTREIHWRSGDPKNFTCFYWHFL